MQKYDILQYFEQFLTGPWLIFHIRVYMCYGRNNDFF